MKKLSLLNESAYQRLFFLAMVILICCLAGCGSSDGSDPVEAPLTEATNGVTFSINWHTDLATTETSQSSADCSQSGVTRVVCKVYSDPDSLVKESDLGACSESTVTIEEIAAGIGRTIVCTGLDDNDNVIRLGQINQVEIFADQLTNAGIMDAYPFIAQPAGPEEGANVTANEFSFNWSTVPNAYHYVVIVAEDPDYMQLIIDDTTTQTTYSPTTLLPDDTYYWKVIPVDRFGNWGMASVSRSCVTQPGTACRAPVISPVGKQIVSAGGAFDLIVSATDMDEDETLRFSTGPLPDDANFNAATGRFTWQTLPDDTGHYAIQFTVCDNCPTGALCNSETVDFIVGDACVPPKLEPLGPHQAIENELLKFNLYVAQQDPEAELTYAAVNLPKGASFNSDTGTFSWTPPEGGSGNYNVTFNACSECAGGPKCDSETMTITVGNACRPPTLSSICSRRANVNQLIEFSVKASDPDPSRHMTIEATDVTSNDSRNLSQYFDPGTRRFSWRPEASDVGTYQVRFKACNDCPAGPQCDEEVINIIVEDPSSTPVNLTPPVLISPEENGWSDNGCSDERYDDPIIWNFNWSQIPQADIYQISILKDGTELISDTTTTTIYTYNCFHDSIEIPKCMVLDHGNETSWTWRVRSGADGNWSDWSEEREFDVRDYQYDCAINFDYPFVTSDVILTPPSPAVLSPGDSVTAGFTYFTPYAERPFISVVPMTNTPDQGQIPAQGYQAPEERLYPEGYQGRYVNISFEIQEEGVQVDSVVVTIRAEDNSYEDYTTVPADYYFTSPSE